MLGLRNLYSTFSGHFFRFQSMESFLLFGEGVVLPELSRA